MKNLLKILVFCMAGAASVPTLNAQATFNRPFYFNYPAAALTAVYTEDSLIYMAGIVADTVPPKYPTSALFARMDLAGELIDHRVLAQPGRTFETWFSTLIRTADGDLAISGYSIDSIGMTGFIQKRTLSGDQFAFWPFNSLYYPETSYILPRTMTQCPDSGFFAASLIKVPDAADLDIQLTKIDTNGQIVWDWIYGDSIVEEPYVAVYRDNKLYLGFYSGNYNLFEVEENFVHRSHILELDTAGQVLRRYDSGIDRDEGGIRDMLPTADGGWVVLTKKGQEVFINSIKRRVRWDTGCLYKLDAGFEKVWEVDFRGWLVDGDDIVLNKMVAASDSSGYVAVGNGYFDSVDLTADMYGWMVKASPDGDSLWSRKFKIQEDTVFRHFLYDVKETADGGFVAVGQAQYFGTSPPPGTPKQRGWVIKTDPYGCLVPGCHLPLNTGEAPGVTARILAYPNPAGETLAINLVLSENPPEQAMLNLIDNTGCPVRRLAVRDREMTYILSVADLPAGIYSLQYLAPGSRPVSEKIVITH